MEAVLWDISFTCIHTWCSWVLLSLSLQSVFQSSNLPHFNIKPTKNAKNSSSTSDHLALTLKVSQSTKTPMFKCPSREINMLTAALWTLQKSYSFITTASDFFSLNWFFTSLNWTFSAVFVLFMPFWSLFSGIIWQIIRVALQLITLTDCPRNLYFSFGEYINRILLACSSLTLIFLFVCLVPVQFMNTTLVCIINSLLSCSNICSL